MQRQLGPDFWYDRFAFFFSSEYQYPVLERVLSIQRMVLARFLDARSLARAHLRQIDGRIQRVLSKNAKGVQIDSYFRAHLEEIHDQIAKTFKALLQVNDL